MNISSAMMAAATTQSLVVAAPDLPHFSKNAAAGADGDSHTGNGTPNENNDSSKNAAADTVGNDAHAGNECADIDNNNSNVPVTKNNGNSNVVVGGHHIIEGVVDLTDECRSHVVVFYEQLILQMENASQTNQLMTKEKFLLFKEALLRLRGGKTIIHLWGFYQNIYKWKKRFALVIVVSGDSGVLVAKPSDIVSHDEEIDSSCFVDHIL